MFLRVECSYKFDYFFNGENSALYWKQLTGTQVVAGDTSLIEESNKQSRINPIATKQNQISSMSETQATLGQKFIA